MNPLPTVHYGDCTWNDLAPVSRTGRWSTLEGVEQLRRHLQGQLCHDAEPLDPLPAEVVAWVRRKTPELRGRADEATPDQLYRRVAVSGHGEALFRSGRKQALHVGYGDLVDGIDDWILSRFVGLGCPWRQGLPPSGHRVADLGCGAGLDLVIAARAVGLTGSAVGVDRLPHLAADGPMGRSGRVVLGSAGASPLRPGWFDLVVANGLPPLLGVLSARPTATDIARALRPGGALRFVTIVVGGDAPIEELSDEDVVDAVRCSKPVCDQYRILLADCGFAEVRIIDGPSPFAPGYRAGPVRAVMVEAVWPGP